MDSTQFQMSKMCKSATFTSGAVFIINKFLQQPPFPSHTVERGNGKQWNGMVQVFSVAQEAADCIPWHKFPL